MTIRRGMWLSRDDKLRQKYKVNTLYTDNTFCDNSKWDVVLKRLKVAYGYTDYIVLKNGPKLPKADLAVLCSFGNLQYGYSLVRTSALIFPCNGMPGNEIELGAIRIYTSVPKECPS